MPKFYGNVGFGVTKETSPGVWEESIVDRQYAGDISKNSRRYSTSDKVNDDISLDLTVSIIADPFFFQNIGNIKYVEYLGSKWKVSSIELQYPRLNLSIGGLYHGD